MSSKTTLCWSGPSTGPRTDRRLTDGAPEHACLTELVRQPWWLRVDGVDLLIRPAAPKDLEAVAGMHGRCSARSLLDRYRTGGRAPAVAALDHMLRRPLSFVASTARGEIVATAVAATDQRHGPKSAEAGLLVEDAWQRLGMGRELMTHLAGAALVCGYRDLIAYPATSVLVAQRLLIDVGRTRVVRLPDDLHLHATLPESAALGLGPVRERLAS
jgi:GNAT superfamily N-acetyltransferase